MMNNVDTIQGRFSNVFIILKRYFWKYFTINLGLTIFWLCIFGLIIFISLLIGIIEPVFSTIVNLFKGHLHLNGWGPYLGIIFPFLFLSILFFWLISSTIFIANFYLTKKLLSGDKIDLTQIFILSFKKLYHKAVVDFWYFLVYLLVFLVFLFLFIILIFIYSLHSFWLSFLFTISFILLSVWIYFIVLVKYFFGYYYCFDNENYSFNHFFSVSRLVKDKLSVLGNILLIFIISYGISSFLNSVFTFSLNTEHIIFSVIFILIINYLVKLIFSIFSFVYFFVYYKYLISGLNKYVNEKIDNTSLNIKDL